MNNHLTNKTPKALVTGSSKRLGRAMVHYLASVGYDVALHYNNSDTEVLALQSELKLLFPNGQFPLVQFNLLQWAQVGRLFNLLPDDFQQLDLLVNNASIFNSAKIAETSPELLMDNFAIHLFAPFMLIQTFAKCSKGGLVVNLLDTKVVKNDSSHAAYLLSKKTLAHLTQMAALALAPGIRVNGIAPGPVLPAVGGDNVGFDSVVKQTPLKQAVNVDEITSALAYFIHNVHVTGQILFVDSGSHLK